MLIWNPEQKCQKNSTLLTNNTGMVHKWIRSSDLPQDPIDTYKHQTTTTTSHLRYQLRLSSWIHVLRDQLRTVAVGLDDLRQHSQDRRLGQQRTLIATLLRRHGVLGSFGCASISFSCALQEREIIRDSYIQTS